jgi:hypothetical protein
MAAIMSEHKKSHENLSVKEPKRDEKKRIIRERFEIKTDPQESENSDNSPPGLQRGKLVQPAGDGLLDISKGHHKTDIIT